MKEVARCIAKRTTYTTHGLPGAECPHDSMRGLPVCGKHMPEEVRGWLENVEFMLVARLSGRFKITPRPGEHFAVSVEVTHDALLPEIARAVRAAFPDRAEALLVELERRLLP